MQSTLKIITSICMVVILVLSLISNSESASLRQRRSSMDPSLTVAVLEDLLENIQNHNEIKVERRRLDAGYRNRYDLANSVGSKLMALKQAADWNGPGRKRRGVDETLLLEQ